jgi:uncharacterized protein
MKRLIWLFLIAIGCLNPYSTSTLLASAAESPAQIRLQNERLVVEIARTIHEQAMGLMGRKDLPEGTGMLFVYEKPQILYFWMKNTHIPLSIGFFDASRRLINIEDMDPPKGQELPVYQSQKPARYALEVPQGWFDRHGIRPGLRFEWERNMSFPESGK